MLTTGRWLDDAQPTVAEIVAITTTDSDPYLLVCTTNDELATGVLLADLATETIHRLRASEPDTATRRELASAIGRADECMSFTIPTTDCASANATAAVLGHSQEVSADGPRRHHSHDLAVLLSRTGSISDV